LIDHRLMGKRSVNLLGFAHRNKFRCHPANISTKSTVPFRMVTVSVRGENSLLLIVITPFPPSISLCICLPTSFSSGVELHPKPATVTKASETQRTTLLVKQRNESQTSSVQEVSPRSTEAPDG
jgi:hypothetical protein